MSRVVVLGERGEVIQIVRIGPATLVRPQVWDDLDRLAQMFTAAGHPAETHDPSVSVADLEEPDCWVLSDLPFAAAVAIGLYPRLCEADGRAGMLMLGGALSFAGQQGVGGWAAANEVGIWPVHVDAVDDAVETPDGLVMRATGDCPEPLRTAIRSAPPLYGYNRVTPRPDSHVFAELANGAPAIVMAERYDRRRLAFTSDLMPHWGAGMQTWERLPDFVSSLIRLVVQS